MFPPGYQTGYQLPPGFRTGKKPLYNEIGPPMI